MEKEVNEVLLEGEKLIKENEETIKKIKLELEEIEKQDRKSYQMLSLLL